MTNPISGLGNLEAGEPASHIVEFATLQTNNLIKLRDEAEIAIKAECNALEKALQRAVAARSTMLINALRNQCQSTQVRMEARVREALSNLDNTTQSTPTEDLLRQLECPMPQWDDFVGKSLPAHEKILASFQDESRTSCAEIAEQCSATAAKTLGSGSAIDSTSFKFAAPKSGTVDCSVVVAFGAVEHICNEGDSNVVLKLVRRGETSGATSVALKSRNINVPPASYKDFADVVTFQPGESTQTSTLPLIDNDFWNAEAIQVLTLEPSSDGSFALGDLAETSVVILDSDRFPTNSRENYITGTITLPLHIPYEEKAFKEAARQFFQGETKPTNHRASSYKVADDDVTVAQISYGSEPVKLKITIGVAEHMLETLLFRAKSLHERSVLEKSEPGPLDVLYQHQLEASTVDIDSLKADSATPLMDKNDSFIYGEDFTTSTARLATVWSMVLFVFINILSKRQIALAVCIKMYASVNWLVEQLFMLIAINTLVSEGGQGEELASFLQIAKEEGEGGGAEANGKAGDSSGKSMVLYTMCALFAGNLIINQILTRIYTKMELGATVRSHLRKEGMSVMLQLNADEKERVNPGHTLSILTERIRIIAEAFVAFMDLISNACLTIAMVLMVSYLSSEIEGPEKPLGAGMAVALVSINSIIFAWRFNESVNLDDKAIKDEDASKQSLLEYIDLSPLITTYRQGRKMAIQFGTLLHHHDLSELAHEVYDENTEFLVEWLTTGILLMLYMWCGKQVIAGEMRMGTFVVLVETLIKFSAHVDKTFENVRTTTTSFSCIVHTASLFNAQTRRRDLLFAAKRRENLLDRYIEEKKIEAAKGATEEHDHTDIVVAPGTVIEYADKDAAGLPIKRSHSLPGVVTEQGQIVAVRTPGRQAAGKQTFLKTLARNLIPVEGFVTMPENLRVRLIPPQPSMLDGTVYRNLKFGNQHDHCDEDMRNLCSIMNLSPALYAIEEDGSWGQRIVGKDGQKLAMSDRIRVVLIRALLSSVDLLLLDNVLDPLSEDDAHQIVGILETFVENRGFTCLTADMRAAHKLRKKKTVILSTRSLAIESRVHNILVLPQTDGS